MSRLTPSIVAVPLWDQAAHKAFVEADRAWTDELVRLFGKRAGDVRYTSKANGEPGTKLAELYGAYKAARDAWHASIQR